MKTIIRALKSVLPLRWRKQGGRLTPADVCSRFSRGNVSIQLGRIFFDDELNAMKKANFEYGF